MIQAALVREGLAPPSTLAFVGSLAASCLSVFAIPNSKLIRHYGAKKVLLAGATLLGLGMISASFAVKNVAALFVTSGVITGIGGSMIYLVSHPRQFSLRAHLIFLAGSYTPQSILCQKERSSYWYRHCVRRSRRRSDCFTTWISHRESRGGMVSSNPGAGDTSLCHTRYSFHQRETWKNKSIHRRLVSISSLRCAIRR